MDVVRFARWLIPALLILGMLVIPSVPVSGWGLGEHWKELTKPVLEKEGWKNQEAIDKVVDCNMAVDLLGLVFLTDIIYPAASARKAEVKQKIEGAAFNTPDTTDGFHFDDLFKYSDIEKRWVDLEAWAKAKAAAIAGEDRPEDEKKNNLLCLMGIVSHAVQDFYAHSNWVNRLNEFTAGFNPGNPGQVSPAANFPTWDELVNNAGNWRGNNPGFKSAAALERLKQSDKTTSTKDSQGGLQTGRWDKKTTTDPTTGQPVKPWKHRDPSGAEAAVAKELAKRSMEEWKEKILGSLPPGFRDNVENLVTEDQASSGPPQIDEAAHGNFIATLELFVPPLGETEEIDVVLAAEGTQNGILLEDGQISEFKFEPFESPTILARAAAGDVIVNILTASDPLLEASAAHARGELWITRPNGGGIAEAIPASDAPATSTSSGSDHTAPVAAAAVLAGTLAIAAGAWYVRRHLS